MAACRLIAVGGERGLGDEEGSVVSIVICNQAVDSFATLGSEVPCKILVVQHFVSLRLFVYFTVAALTYLTPLV